MQKKLVILSMNMIENEYCIHKTIKILKGIKFSVQIEMFHCFYN